MHERKRRSPDGSSGGGTQTDIHPLANERVDQDDLKPAKPAPNDAILDRIERRIGGFLLAVIAGLVLVGTVAGILLVQEYSAAIAIIGGVIVIALGMLYLWPVLAARGTKIAQDEQVRPHR